MRKAHAGTGTADVREIQKPDEQWRQELTPLQYSVLREAHTERRALMSVVAPHLAAFGYLAVAILAVVSPRVGALG